MSTQQRSPRSFATPSGKFPSWVTDRNDPMEKKLIRWAYLSALRNRGILFKDVGAYLGISVQRVEQLIKKMGESDEERLDEALTAITEERHHALGHTDDNPTCAVLSLALRNELPEVRESKIKLETERLAEARKLWEEADDKDRV